jgi:outer membrane protein OmpA-like peptidoglycan-associated protein
MQGVVFPVRTGNRAAADQDATKALGTVVGAVRSLRADSNGSDVVAALGVAHDVAASAGTGQATIVVLDPMIPDTGPLRLTDPSWAKADPKDVADFLAQNGNLPAGDHLHYVLVGIGYTTAPQKALTPAMRQNLTAIWTAVLERGGATVTVDPDPRQGTSPKTGFTTATLAVQDLPQPAPCAGTQVVYDNASPVGFNADQATLRDPQAAAKALADIGSWLRADPHRHAHVVGTTANVGELAGQVVLSKMRAATVQQLLVGSGVPAGQLDTNGVGSRFPDYQPDAGNPAAMQANRSVRITLSGPSSC